MAVQHLLFPRGINGFYNTIRQQPEHLSDVKTREPAWRYRAAERELRFKWDIT